MGKSQAFAIATQQSHATGHTPKSYGTPEGKREAKAKYDEPKKTYENKSDPGQVGKKVDLDKIKQAGVGDFFGSLKRNPRSDELEVAFKHYEKSTGKPRTQMSHADINKHLDLTCERLKSKTALDLSRGLQNSNSVINKLAGVSQILSHVLVPEQQKQVQELRQEIDQLKASLPQPKASRKIKKASRMLRSADLVVLGGFSSELQKLAFDSSTGRPPGLTEIKSTVPTQLAAGKTPKYSKVNSENIPSPLAGKQPISDPPPVRA